MKKMKKGVFVLSLDTELAWGCCGDQKSIKISKSYFLDARKSIHTLINLFEKYDISATWAVVGHLFLSHCQHENGIKHPEIIRPNYKWHQNRDWFDCDPCSSVESDPIWYGKDIIDMIKGCKVPQEIGSHTFSHVIVGDPGCTRECFGSEIALCKEIAAESGVELKSFVFPQNNEKYHDVLARNGFETYRGNEPYWFMKLPTLLQPFGRMVDCYLALCPPVSNPVKNACWNIQGSYFWGHRHGLWKLLPISQRVKQTKKGIDRAIRDGTVFHLWFHPFNLSTDPQGLTNGLEAVFSYINVARAEGRIENLTMGALARRLEKQDG
jgi:peptidoglycan/xylan/chitin deacetylase (PgdA/CDA1 family)